jgi:hypothetical protein
LARDRNIHISVGFYSQTDSDRGYQCQFAQTNSDRPGKAAVAAACAQNSLKKSRATAVGSGHILKIIKIFCPT